MAARDDGSNHKGRIVDVRTTPVRAMCPLSVAPRSPFMALKHAKKELSPAPVPTDMAGSGRAALIAAYQAGIIAAWKRDPERGYRLTIAGHRDDYVAVTALPRYLAKLRGAA